MTENILTMEAFIWSFVSHFNANKLLLAADVLSIVFYKYVCICSCEPNRFPTNILYLCLKKKKCFGLSNTCCS